MRRASEAAFDVVLLDLHMPELDGFEVVRALRALPHASGIPILILTAKELTDGERASLRSSVQAIVRKPERQRTAEEQKIYDDYFPVLRVDPSKIKQIMPKEEIPKYDALLAEQRQTV